MSAGHTKAILMALLDEVAAGEEVEVTKRGHVMARIVPAGSARSVRGCARSIAASNAADEELFDIGPDHGDQL